MLEEVHGCQQGLDACAWLSKTPRSLQGGMTIIDGAGGDDIITLASGRSRQASPLGALAPNLVAFLFESLGDLCIAAIVTSRTRSLGVTNVSL